MTNLCIGDCVIWEISLFLKSEPATQSPVQKDSRAVYWEIVWQLSTDQSQDDECFPADVSQKSDTVSQTSAPQSLYTGDCVI